MWDKTHTKLMRQRTQSWETKCETTGEILLSSQTQSTRSTMSQTNPILVHMDVSFGVPVFGGFKGTPKEKPPHLVLPLSLFLGGHAYRLFFEEQLCSGRRPFWGWCQRATLSKQQTNMHHWRSDRSMARSRREILWVVR